MKKSFKLFRVVGDTDGFDPIFDECFELVKSNEESSGLRFVYVDAFPLEAFDCEKDALVEVGRCEIGIEWGTPWLEVVAFEITPTHRKRHWGRDFFKELKSFAKSHGFSYIWLNPQNDDARTFWRKQGGVSINELDNVDFVPPELGIRHLVFDLNTDGITQGA